MNAKDNRFYREPGDDAYLVWSHEHAAWWAPALGGYTKSLTAARVFSRHEALLVCTEAMPGAARKMGTLPELPVRREDAVMLRDRYRGMCPGLPAEAWQ